MPVPLTMPDQHNIIAETLEDRDGSLWLDGAMANWREARLHALSHGLHYATTVWDGMRVYDGRIFRLAEHVQRLTDSARLLCMEIPFSAPLLREACLEAVKAQNIRNGYVRPVAWRGAESLYLDPAGTRVHVAVAAWGFAGSYDAVAKEEGISLAITSWRRPPPETLPWQAKAAGIYATGVMAKQEAAGLGYDDALMLDWRGFIAEATAANVFLVIGGALHTPLADCFLNGITRRTVIGMAGRRGIAVTERHIEPGELAQAEEVFVTGTAAEITPVRAIDGQDYSVGPITRQMMEDYSGVVRGE